MFRHRLPSYKRLIREGERAEGLILTVEKPLTWTTGMFKFRIRIRARIPGGGEPEVTRMVDTRELVGEFAHAGDTVPLRFSPGKPERIDIDLPEWRARILAERERIEAEHLRLGEEKWKEGESP